MYRNTYVKINETTLKNNVKTIIKKYNQYQYYFGVVKGNCYGHGFYSVKALVEAGVNYLAVSSLEEAIEVRKYEKEIPILCLEPISSKHVEEIIRYKVTITIDSLDTAVSYVNKKFKGKIKVHLKLDTGMNRLGMKSRNEIKEVISLLEENHSFIIEGIYTHMATTGINDYYFDKQIERFRFLTQDIDLSKIDIVHIGRSLTLVNHDKLDFVNGIRMGIIMFGFNGSIYLRKGFKGFILEKKRQHFLKKYHISKTYRVNDLKLATAFSLYTEVMSIKKVKAGETIGYGASFVAKKDMLVATLPIGYADGMSEKMKFVAISNKKYPIVGQVCMDMTMIEVDKNVKLHDRVEIFGDSIKVRDVSRLMGTNAYHVFMNITTRVPRIYQDGTEIKY
jgi:alanine racemase